MECFKISRKSQKDSASSWTLQHQGQSMPHFPIGARFLLMASALQSWLFNSCDIKQALCTISVEEWNWWWWQPDLEGCVELGRVPLVSGEDYLRIKYKHSFFCQNHMYYYLAWLLRCQDIYSNRFNCRLCNLGTGIFHSSLVMVMCRGKGVLWKWV